MLFRSIVISDSDDEAAVPKQQGGAGAGAGSGAGSPEGTAAPEDPCTAAAGDIAPAAAAADPSLPLFRPALRAFHTRIKKPTPECALCTAALTEGAQHKETVKADTEGQKNQFRDLFHGNLMIVVPGGEYLMVPSVRI